MHKGKSNAAERSPVCPPCLLRISTVPGSYSPVTAVLLHGGFKANCPAPVRTFFVWLVGWFEFFKTGFLCLTLAALELAL